MGICKWREVEGLVTKHFYCKVKGKAIDEINCRDCMLKITNCPEQFEELFKGFKK